MKSHTSVTNSGATLDVCVSDTADLFPSSFSLLRGSRWVCEPSLLI